MRVEGDRLWMLPARLGMSPEVKKGGSAREGPRLERTGLVFHTERHMGVHENGV